MPTLTVEAPHALGATEAKRRLQAQSAAMQTEHAGRFSDLQENWDDHRGTFNFKAMGMKFGAEVQVADERVALHAEIPLFAMMFKGMIEQRIRAELERILA